MIDGSWPDPWTAFLALAVAITLILAVRIAVAAVRRRRRLHMADELHALASLLEGDVKVFRRGCERLARIRRAR